MSEDIASQDYTYTRAGAFKLNKDNFVTDAAGNYLQGFPVDPGTGNTTSLSLSTASPIQIPDASGSPRHTSNVYSSMNLDSRAGAPSTTPFEPTDSTSYNSSTSTTIYDSLGEPHVIQLFFVKQDPAVANNSWQVYATMDETPIDINGNETAAGAHTPIDTLQFTAAGLPDVTAPDVTFPDIDILSTGTTGLSGRLSNGAQFPNNITVNWSDEANTANKLPTQYASRFEVKALEQDGATVGRLAGIDIGTDGKVVASYSNGDTSFLGQVAMVRFSNSQGLAQVGGTAWKKSLTSGEPIAGEPASGTLGTINSSALEQSNVNLTNELVDLISAQRNFQANSRALEVNSTLQQNILQIR
jgi:flagellar hook protein FlgE